jgi:hypothetical protein
MRTVNYRTGVYNCPSTRLRRPACPFQHYMANFRPLVEWTQACPRIQGMDLDFGRRQMRRELSDPARVDHLSKSILLHYGCLDPIYMLKEGVFWLRWHL